MVAQMETGSNNVTRLRGGDGTVVPQRTPPVNYDAEKALLGAILANNLVYDRVNEFLRPEHFADHPVYDHGIRAWLSDFLDHWLMQGAQAPRLAAAE